MRCGLTAALSMLGDLAGDELRQACQDTDIFALPSYREGFPTVIAEAMDPGQPLISTQIRGAADVLVQETNASFVPLGGLTSWVRVSSDCCKTKHFERAWEPRTTRRWRSSTRDGRQPAHRITRVALRPSAHATLSAPVR
jgi:hypothetical protein